THYTYHGTTPRRRPVLASSPAPTRTTRDRQQRAVPPDHTAVPAAAGRAALADGGPVGAVGSGTQTGRCGWRQHADRELVALVRIHPADPCPVPLIPAATECRRGTDHRQTPGTATGACA